MKQKLLHSLPLLIGFWLFCLLPQEAKAQQVAVKTNGLMWAAMIPNVASEFVVGERSTIDLGLFGTTTIYGHEAKILGLQPEYRYYFNGRPMTREFVGVAALGATYDITWGKRFYKGDALGLGVTMGYVMNLGRRWNVEFYGGFGVVSFKQKEYLVDTNFGDYAEEQVNRTNSTGYKLLPTKIGLSISYIIR